MFVNARAIIERETPTGTEIVVQIRNKPHEGGKWIELPGGRVEEFESLVSALKREVQEETGLILTHIDGLSTKVDTQGTDTNVECLQPFAVYQTKKGPVDSMGVYFLCRAEGRLLDVGHEAEYAQWTPVHRIAKWMAKEAEKLFWVDRAGLLFYLKWVGKLVRE
ncbi:MAG: NUDIX hydrolase [Chloroflexota bacterium]|nr:NUDIX hydrolase [Chloroflexota bacterium]